MKEVIIEANDAGQRLDKFLAKAFPALKKSAMYKAIRNKKIKVNRKRAAFDQILQEKDSILLFLPPDLLETKEAEVSEKPLDVLYEDEEILAVYKPAGLLVQKDEAGFQDTLNGRIVNYLIQSGQYSQKENSFIPSAAHRLDRNTSGIVLAAKTAPAARKLAAAIKNHDIRKSYLAKVQGIPDEGRVVLYMKKDGTKALVSDTPKEGYDEALMDVKVLSREGDQSWIEVDLITGRFHQIRAGMAFLGHPVIGDPKYGNAKPGSHQLLQAYKTDLTNADFINHPVIELKDKYRIDRAGS